MASHLNENSEVKETLLSEEKRSKPKIVIDRLKRRRRRDPHSGTRGLEFTAATGISEAKENTSDQRHDSERGGERLFVAIVERPTVYPRSLLSPVDYPRSTVQSNYDEVIPGALQDLLPIAIDDEADLIRQEMANDDELDFVHQEIQMLENAPDGPLLAMANNQDGWRLKDVLRWVVPITNFTMELPSAVFDQLSSKNHPKYALIVMLFSFIALMACIAELIYQGKMERVTWQWRGRVPWFYRPTRKPFVSIWEIIGFACAFLQCFVTTINYSFISQHHDGPIKTSALPILFAFGLLCSKYLKKPERNRGGNPRFNIGALQD